MKADQNNLFRAAGIISIIGHPFVLLPITVLMAALDTMPPAHALTVAIITILVTVVPLWLIIRHKVAAGKWSDHDISEPSERGSFYPVALIVAASAGGIFRLLNFPLPLLIGVIISIGLLLAAALINQWSKISLHLMFITYCAVSMIAISSWTAAVLIVLAVAVGWSRVMLKRHTLVQVLSGAALGTAGGILLLKLIARL